MFEGWWVAVAVSTVTALLVLLNDRESGNSTQLAKVENVPSEAAALISDPVQCGKEPQRVALEVTQFILVPGPDTESSCLCGHGFFTQWMLART